MRERTSFPLGFAFAPLAAVCLTALWLCVPTTAQSIFASIVGTVTDASGAVVPNAKVAATNVNTNEKREFLTDRLGNYEINNLFPGVYVVEVEASGFTKQRREGIRLASNDNARADVPLTVAKALTEVTVLAEPGARVETESAKLSDTRSLRELQSLPLAERSAYRYLALTPGVTGGVTTMSVSGSRARQVHFAVDGVTMSDIRSSTTVGPTLNYIEAFEEIKIDTSNNSAEFKGLGTLNVTTKRGGNDLHGSVFDYYSTGAFRALDPFTGSKDNSPNHGFGTSASGPIYLPKLYDGRNKTFWFLSYETGFAPQSVYNVNITVPPALWRGGDFSREATVVRDPLNNGSPFPNNVIPEPRISNAAKQYFAFWPLPNFGDLDSAAGQNYREQVRASFAKAHNAQVRVDHIISRSNTIFGRYLYNRQYAAYLESGLPGTLGYGQTIRRVRHALISDTHIFSPTLINEFRFGISMDSLPWKNTLVNGPAFIRAAGLTNVTRDGTIPDVRQIPIVTFSQGAGIQEIYPTAEEPLGQSRTFQWQDTVSKIAGKHSFRGGIEINWRHGNIQQEPDNLLGASEFTNRYTGINFADFLLGIPDNVSRSGFLPPRYDRQIAYDFFVQDNYRVTADLTLNLGLRYELHPGWTTNGNRISAFDSKTGSIVVPDSALPLVSDLFPTNLVPVIGNSNTDFNDRLLRTDKNNWAPRIGFAWRPFQNQTFVIRGGYGIFYEIIPVQQTLFGTPFVVNEPAYTNPSDVNDPGFIQWPLAFPTAVEGAGVSLPAYYASDFRTPYAQNWNITIEKEVSRMVLRASYVGTGARKMAYAFNINQPAPGPELYINKPRLFPTLPAIPEQRNGASHNYNALNLEAEGRYRGLVFQTNLTVAKDVGDDSVTPENTFDRSRERGPMQLLPHRRWVGFFVYELPYGKGKRYGGNMNSLMNILLGGWELSASATLRDGQNETPLWRMPDIHGIAHTTSSTPAQVNYRPDCLADPNFSNEQQTLEAWYNVNAFSLPATPGVFGSCGRGIIQGPAVRVLHAGLFKRFKVGERLSFRFGTQATNIFNHPNYSNLSASALRIDNTSARGQVTSSYSSGAVGDAAGPRFLRLDLRIDF